MGLTVDTDIAFLKGLRVILSMSCCSASSDEDEFISSRREFSTGER